MTGGNDKIFLDTNILVYAYDANEGKKHLKAKNLVSKCFFGLTEFYISNQVLSEFSDVIQRKIQTPVQETEVKEIIEEINKVENWKKINYSTKTLEMVFFEKGKHFWDRLIAATMKENSVFRIYTENTSDFKEITGIQAINPLQ